MTDTDETDNVDETSVDLERLRGQQIYARAPKRIGHVLADLMALRGYAQADAARKRAEVWQQIVGQRMAEHSHAGEIRRGTLTILAGNSMVLQELDLRKQELLERINQALPEQRVRKILLKVGKLA